MTSAVFLIFNPLRERIREAEKEETCEVLPNFSYLIAKISGKAETNSDVVSLYNQARTHFMSKS